jgi:hypothetical protein
MSTDDQKSANAPKSIPQTAEREERRAMERAKPGATSTTDLDHGHDDGPLDSIGKAISAPVRDAATEDDV